MVVQDLDLANVANSFASHTFAQPGIYQAYLVAHGSCNRDSTLPIQIQVSPSPIALFSFQSANICLTDSAKFINQSPSQNNGRFEWSFGDNSPIAVLSNPAARKYAQAGTYTVRLKVVSLVAPFCFSIIEKTLVVRLVPIAVFNLPTIGCQGKPILLDASGSAFGVSYKWQLDTAAIGPGAVIIQQYAKFFYVYGPEPVQCKTGGL